MPVSVTTDPHGEPERTSVEAIDQLGRRLLVWLAILTLALAALGAWLWTTAEQTHRLAEHNCTNITGLAGIERTFIQQQQQQTTDLLKRGFTFGIPKDQLAPLVKATESSQAAFLTSFDALALTNC
jgi:hypothetical protein